MDRCMAQDPTIGCYCSLEVGHGDTHIAFPSHDLTLEHIREWSDPPQFVFLVYRGGAVRGVYYHLLGAVSGNIVGWQPDGGDMWTNGSETVVRVRTCAEIQV